MSDNHTSSLAHDPETLRNVAESLEFLANHHLSQGIDTVNAAASLLRFLADREEKRALLKAVVDCDHCDHGYTDSEHLSIYECEACDAKGERHITRRPLTDAEWKKYLAIRSEPNWYDYL